MEKNKWKKIEKKIALKNRIVVGMAKLILLPQAIKVRLIHANVDLV